MKIGMIPIRTREAEFTENWTTFGLSLKMRRIEKTLGTQPHLIKIDIASKLQSFEFEKHNKGNLEALIHTIQVATKQLYYEGVEFAFIPYHLPREVFSEIAKKSPIRLVNLVDVVTDKCLSRDIRSVGFIGSTWMVDNKLYSAPLAEAGIATALPSEEDQKTLESIINITRQTITITESDQEKIRRVFGKFKKENSFGALVVANLELMHTLRMEFTQVETFNPYKDLADKVVALTLNPLPSKKLSPTPERIDRLTQRQLINTSGTEPTLIPNTPSKGNQSDRAALPPGIWTE